MSELISSGCSPRVCDNCNKRRLKEIVDAHVLCEDCRGQDCLRHRCDECDKWPLEVYKDYVQQFKKRLVSKLNRRKLRATKKAKRVSTAAKKNKEVSHVEVSVTEALGMEGRDNVNLEVVGVDELQVQGCLLRDPGPTVSNVENVFVSLGSIDVPITQVTPITGVIESSGVGHTCDVQGALQSKLDKFDNRFESFAAAMQMMASNMNSLTKKMDKLESLNFNPEVSNRNNANLPNARESGAAEQSIQEKEAGKGPTKLSVFSGKPFEYDFRQDIDYWPYSGGRKVGSSRDYSSAQVMLSSVSSAGALMVNTTTVTSASVSTPFMVTSSLSRPVTSVVPVAGASGWFPHPGQKRKLSSSSEDSDVNSDSDFSYHPEDEDELLQGKESKDAKTRPKRTRQDSSSSGSRRSFVDEPKVSDYVRLLRLLEESFPAEFVQEQPPVSKGVLPDIQAELGLLEAPRKSKVLLPWSLGIRQSIASVNQLMIKNVKEKKASTSFSPQGITGKKRSFYAVDALPDLVYSSGKGDCSLLIDPAKRQIFPQARSFWSQKELNSGLSLAFRSLEIASFLDWTVSAVFRRLFTLKKRLDPVVYSEIEDSLGFLNVINKGIADLVEEQTSLFANFTVKKRESISALMHKELSSDQLAALNYGVLHRDSLFDPEVVEEVYKKLMSRQVFPRRQAFSGYSSGSGWKSRQPSRGSSQSAGTSRSQERSSFRAHTRATGKKQFFRRTASKRGRVSK